MARSKPISEIVVVYLGVCAATFLITQLGSVPGFEEYVHLLVGATFLLVAIRLAQRDEDGLRRHGIDLSGLLTPSDDPAPRGPLGLFDLGRAARRAAPSAARESAVALGVAAVLFPAFALGFYLYYQPTGGFEPAFRADVGAFALAQLLVVALPEEALFRGYFQTRLSDLWPKTHRILGVHVSIMALVAQAALFAVIHLVELHPSRLAVFFPGLLFGFLRAWRGGIGAAILLHALSNLFADFLQEAWL